MKRLREQSLIDKYAPLSTLREASLLGKQAQNKLSSGPPPPILHPLPRSWMELFAPDPALEFKAPTGVLGRAHGGCSIQARYMPRYVFSGAFSTYFLPSASSLSTAPKDLSVSVWLVRWPGSSTFKIVATNFLGIGNRARRTSRCHDWTRFGCRPDARRVNSRPLCALMTKLQL
jgi:hypothetical protein